MGAYEISKDTLLEVHCLGRFQVRHDGRVLALPPTIKAQSLLAYLILHRQLPQPRERLAGLFWGDRPERKARRSLTTALWHIRRCLPNEALIRSDLHSAQIDPQIELWLDVEAFESQVSQDNVSGWQSAVGLYQGHFLEGFYDDWIIGERYRLEGLFADTLARLMIGYEAKGEPEAALTTALRLLAHDPLREDAHQGAMRAYCHLGQRNAALEQFRHCQQVVQEELGTEPLVETVELYQAILERRIAIGPAPETVPLQVPVVEPVTSLGRSPLDAMAPSSLVGRERELEFLVRRWQEAEAGRGGLVLVSGEAGVGKTRLVEEFANGLRWQGTRVLWGRCYEFERMLPYQPLAEALRTALPALTSSAPDDLPAWTLREIARLVPEVLEAHPDLEATPAIRSDEERARLFDGVTRFVAELAAHDTQLIVLEDLHWATASTLQLVHYLVRHLVAHPVLLVGTLRPEAVGRQHPLRALRQQLEREGLAEPLQVSRLSPAAVEAMVVEMAGVGQAVAPLAARLYRETEGNPFFLIEIVKALFESGVVQLAEGVWQGDYARTSEAAIPLPAGVSEAIQARVRRLDEAAQEVLRLAAVLGREFDFELLDAVWGRGEEATLEVLDTLLRQRLVDEGVGPLGRDYAFTHHKIQEVVYAGIPRRRRQHVHARAGAVLERLYGSEAEEVAGELAFHFQEGRRGDEALVEKAMDYRLQAGDRARSLYAHEEAIDHYQQALVLLKERGEHERAARTLMKLGLTHHSAFDFQRSREAYGQGFALWQRSGGTKLDSALSPAPHALRMAWTEPATLDPALSADSTSRGLMRQLFSGLMDGIPGANVVPGIAHSWEVLDGGSKYVFHLRTDVYWSDGVPVTAVDFEYAWKRVLNPVTGSPAADVLYDMKGARSVHQGDTSDPDRVGVRALDEATLTVELEGPTGYFPYLLAHPVTSPVPRHAVETHGDGWADMANIVTNGPFRLEDWQRGESIVLVRNPAYHGQAGGNVQRVELPLTLEGYADLEMYEAEALDVMDLVPLAGVSPVEADRARQRHAGEYVSSPSLAAGFIGFDVSRPPFDDVRVRRAVALAIDRERLAAEATAGFYFPATGGFVPPGMPGHMPGIGLPYDPDRARRLLAEAGYPGGRGFPVIEALLHHSYFATGEHAQAQVQNILGIKVHLEFFEWASFIERLEKNPLHIFGLIRSLFIPDPDNLLRVGFPWELTKWQNGTYEDLVETARRTLDQRERLRLYERAQRILLEKVPIIPFTYARAHLLVKPWVKQFPTSAIWKDTFWKDVIIEPH